MKSLSDIIVVMLRQPRRNDVGEKRSDPFWEYGSFGCTGCHRKNLMNPKRLHELDGKRLAFVQGGQGGFKLVFLSPPVSSKRHLNGSELTWSPSEMPLKYDLAPVIVDNAGNADAPAVLVELQGVHRKSQVARFASKFRSRRTPIAVEFARQLEATYRRCRKRQAAIAKHYEEALPYPPPLIDRTRRATYRGLLADLKGLADTASLGAKCEPKPTKVKQPRRC